MKKLWVSLPLLCAACLSPGSYTQVEGTLHGVIRMDEQHLVAVGTAELDVSTYLPSGIIVQLPLQVDEGTWLAVELATGKTARGELLDPLPESVQLFTPEEWERVIVGELAKLP